MGKIIYHGSEKRIEHPLYGAGKPYNDYGLGFYCTESADMAKEWAVSLDRDGYANKYEIEYEGLQMLNLSDERYCILHWLAILLENREFDVPSALAFEAKEYILQHFLLDYKQYDVIIGYRADDSYFSFAQDFVAGTISLSKLSEVMKLGKLGEQVVLKSKNAFKQIRFIDAEHADSETYSEKKIIRDREARQAYRMARKTTEGINELYMLDIMREGIKNGDSRLR